MAFDLFRKKTPEELVEQYVAKAMKWVATEHYFFQELKQDLNQLKSDLAFAKTNETVADVKKAFRDFRSLAKAERRAQNFETHLESALSGIQAKMPLTKVTMDDVHKLQERLHEEAAQLIRAVSFYDGTIKDLLIHLRDTVEKHEIEQAQAVLAELDQVIANCEQWIGAIAVDYKQAKRYHQIDVDNANVKQAADEALKRREYDKAGELYKKAGLYKKALDAFQKHWPNLEEASYAHIGNRYSFGLIVECYRLLREPEKYLHLAVLYADFEIVDRMLKSRITITAPIDQWLYTTFVISLKNMGIREGKAWEMLGRELEYDSNVHMRTEPAGSRNMSSYLFDRKFCAARAYHQGGLFEPAARAYDLIADHEAAKRMRKKAQNRFW